MLTAKDILFLSLGVFTLLYVAVWALAARRSARVQRRAEPRWAPTLAIGFVATFFDTLGIGNFATTTSAFKLWRLVRDEWIPGTLNVGYTLTTVAQAFIYITIVQVDMRTLVLMIVAACGGAWLGAGVVARWPRRTIQIGMGIALLVAAALMLMTQLTLFPEGGATRSLTGTRLWLGLAGNLALGALMTLGIGLYAPCLILVSLLGMNPTAGFPIMMGSCAFLMPVASARFIREDKYSSRAAVGLALGGVPAVLLAAFIVRSLPLDAVRWLVLVVVVYAAQTLLRSARAERLEATVGQAFRLAGAGGAEALPHGPERS